MPNYIALAIPVFFLAIGIEIAIAARKKQRVYRLADALGDLSAGITQQTLLVFQKGALIFAYVWVYEHHRWITLSSSSLLTWALAMVLVDFTYYWWHRFSHEVNFMWAAHVVHHSSEDYNLAVALRQGVLTPWTAIPLHLPLALIGIPPIVIAGADSFNTLYQFWIHTELVGKLGWFEKLFNTPSHHRVHHGINPRYLDRNYAGILIIWDRMFGTLEVENEPVVYGLVKQLESYNPLWVQTHRWVELWDMARRTKNWGDRVRVWFKGPPWMPSDLPQHPPPPDVVRASYRKYDPRPPKGLQLYMLIQFAVIAIAVPTLMFNEDSPLMAAKVTAGLLILMTVTGWGALSEAKPWAMRLELARLVATGVALVAAASALLPSSALPVAIVGSATLTVAFGAWVLRYRTPTTSVDAMSRAA